MRSAWLEQTGRFLITSSMVLAICALPAGAQEPTEPAVAQAEAAASACHGGVAGTQEAGASANPEGTFRSEATASAAPLCLTLQDALQRARKFNPQFQAVVTDASIAHENSNQSLASLLPSVNYNNEILYTQPGGATGVRFIANNAPHEYISQGNVHETIGVAEIAEFRRVSAAAALAKAKAEIASRGLTVTVVRLYYTLAAAEAKECAAQETANQGEAFLKLTNTLEGGGEVAHSDTIKADLQAEDRRRQLQGSATGAGKCATRTRGGAVSRT